MNLFLFNMITGIILFTCLTIVNVGCMWVLKVMLDEVFTDDVMQKVRKWYGNSLGKTACRTEETSERVVCDTDRSGESLQERRDQPTEVHGSEEETSEGA